MSSKLIEHEKTGIITRSFRILTNAGERKAYFEALRSALRRLYRAVWLKGYGQPAFPFASDVVDRLCAAITAAGHKNATTLPTGATHDATAMADLCGFGMLFVRCRSGVSHRPAEFASAKDMGAAINVLANPLMSFCVNA